MSSHLQAVDYEHHEDIQLFREYLRIPSVHPNVDYGTEIFRAYFMNAHSTISIFTIVVPCVAFLRRIATELNLTVHIERPAHPDKPVVILTWLGTSPQLPSILLNSHMDVVPVYADRWTHAPFGAEIDEAGRIYARGAQDMKCVGTQYLSAIRQLQRNGTAQPKRTVHLVYVPDEEIGGTDGMQAFVQTDAFRSLNVGFALDEGIASPAEHMPVFYAERSVWRVHFRCSGQGGHGSLLHRGTAGEKVRYVIDRMMDRRALEVARLDAGAGRLLVGDVTTVNLTVISGGVQTNVVPPEMTVGFDIRLALDVDHAQFEAWLQEICIGAGGGIDIRFESKKPKVAATPLDATNAYWLAFERVLVKELGLDIRPEIFPGRTDSCFVREAGIPALGFSPMNRTPVLLHDHDEFVAADVYLSGIGMYVKLIAALVEV